MQKPKHHQSQKEIPYPPLSLLPLPLPPLYPPFVSREWATVQVVGLVSQGPALPIALGRRKKKKGTFRPEDGGTFRYSARYCARRSVQPQAHPGAGGLSFFFFFLQRGDASHLQE